MRRSERLLAPRERPAFTVLVAAACLASIGCGGSEWGYVEGVVTLDGAPVGPGTLFFEPTNPDQTRALMTYFGEDGGYELKSAADEPGAPAGEYRVRIYGRGAEAFTEEQAAPPTESKIPPRYRDYATSGLTADIEPGDNTINFQLEP